MKIYLICLKITKNVLTFFFLLHSNMETFLFYLHTYNFSYKFTTNPTFQKKVVLKKV